MGQKTGVLGGRFRNWGCGVLMLAAGLGAAVPARAAPADYSEGVCTVGVEVDPETEEVTPVTTCVHTEDRDGSYSPALGSLYPQIASGRCFYMGTKSSRWVFLELGSDGSLTYGWSPDGRPGGHRVVGTIHPCPWRSVEREEIEGFLWSRIGNYAHQSPRVSFDPPVSRGLVGIRTFAALSPPDPWRYSSTSPYTGSSLQAEVNVHRVRIDWDDGPRQVYGGGDLRRLTGYPNGVGSHTYQTKSCEEAGPRCRSQLGAYEIETAYIWSGWYALGGRRKTLPIPNTSSTHDYPVSEIVSLVVG